MRSPARKRLGRAYASNSCREPKQETSKSHRDYNIKKTFYCAYSWSLLLQRCPVKPQCNLYIVLHGFIYSVDYYFILASAKRVINGVMVKSLTRPAESLAADAVVGASSSSSSSSPKSGMEPWFCPICRKISVSVGLLRIGQACSLPASSKLQSQCWNQLLRHLLQRQLLLQHRL